VPIYFPSGSAELVAEARRWLAHDARCVKERGSPFLVLDGHTDARGDHAHNLELSRRRCEAAAAFLRREGVEIPIEMVARAEAAPLVPGDTELALAHNRRVEVRTVEAH
jgi:outer membrane protein OmpA-like peptidoglycan-associated protein